MNGNTKITFWYEKWRAVSSGILETAANTFLLLIAVKHFEADATAKGIIAGGGSFGLMLTPAVVSLVAKFKLSSSKAASVLALAGAIIFLIMAAFPFLPVFAIGSVAALTASSAVIPLLTQIYHENYPEKLRGTLFSRTVMIRIAVAAGFSHLAGNALSGHLEKFQLLLLIFAAAFALASFCLARCPSQPLTAGEGSHPFRALRFAQTDPIFRRTLICWMLMGFANLMMNPMRVEYLANPKYGLALTAANVAFYTSVLPNLARLVMSPVWGWLFDRMNFFVLRVVLNMGFALGIFSFFTSNDTKGLIIGGIIFGISNAGGDIAWSLWVTKFAPPGRVADYMSVHTFFTGLRGVIAPVAAFHLATILTLPQLAWICASLIVAASAYLLPEIKIGKKAQRTGALVEEVSE
ncbi:MAG: MFS transporter [Verrucomicrobiales bacterium]